MKGLHTPWFAFGIFGIIGFVSLHILKKKETNTLKITMLHNTIEK